MQIQGRIKIKLSLSLRKYFIPQISTVFAFVSHVSYKKKLSSGNLSKYKMQFIHKGGKKLSKPKWLYVKKYLLLKSSKGWHRAC